MMHPSAEGPRVDAYGPTHPGAETAAVLPSRAASTVTASILDRIEPGVLGPRETPPRPSPPVPLARASSAAPTVALVLVVLAVVSWAFARFVL